MSKNVDTKQLEELYEKLKKASGKDIKKDIAKELGQRLLRNVKRNTPVDTGELRRNWNSQGYETATSYDVEVFNQTKYAPYVEYGHRKRGGNGFVNGQLMLTKSELRLRKKAPEIINSKLEKMMREAGL